MVWVCVSVLRMRIPYLVDKRHKLADQTVDGREDGIGLIGKRLRFRLRHLSDTCLDPQTPGILRIIEAARQRSTAHDDLSHPSSSFVQRSINATHAFSRPSSAPSAALSSKPHDLCSFSFGHQCEGSLVDDSFSARHP